MPFFQPFFAGRVEFARAVFYALYGSLVLTSACVLLVRADVRRRVLLFALVATVAVAAAALHPIGSVTRGYIIAMGMGGTVMVLMLGSAPGVILRLTAAVTTLNASLCFVDLLFADGFTTTVGRAAGLAINPNVAAASILLGAAASHRALPRRFRLGFVVLIAGSLVVTMSRSTMLAAGAAIAAAVVGEAWRRHRTLQPVWTAPKGIRPAAFVAIAVVAWIGVAAFTNHRLRPVVGAVITDSLSFAHAIEEAHESVARVAEATPAPVPSPAAPASGSSTDAPRIAALDARLSSEGSRNTISARTLFLERALLEYRSNGFFGVGLEKAHPLVPHNTFVLFALAFGHVGWLIPMALVALSLYLVCDPSDLPLSVAMAGVMATSHDILLTPSLLLPIAIGIGGMLGGGMDHEVDRRVRRSIVFGAVAGTVLFVLGCLLILRSTPLLGIERLNPLAITSYRGAYLAYLPPQTYPGLFVPSIGPGPEETTSFLRDDGRPLIHVSGRPGGRPPVDVGQYAARDGVVFFMPPDASDPRTSGHVVELGLPRAVGLPFYGLVLTLAVWCVGVMLWGCRSARRLAVDAAGVVR